MLAEMLHVEVPPYRGGCTHCGAEFYYENEDGDWICWACARYLHLTPPPLEEMGVEDRLKKPLIASGIITPIAYCGNHPDLVEIRVYLVLMRPKLNAGYYRFECPLGDGSCCGEVSMSGEKNNGERRWRAKCEYGHSVVLKGVSNSSLVPAFWYEGRVKESVKCV